MGQNEQNEQNKKKKKKKKRISMKAMQDRMINYMADKAGLMGEATRAIKKRKKRLENVMQQTK